MKWYERLLPARVRKRAELKGEERARLWVAVADNDSCLRAVTDVLDDLIEGNAAKAGDLSVPHDVRLEACNRLQIARQILDTIESERAAAREMIERERKEK